MDIFTRMIHGIRLRYAAVSVVFLVVAVGLLHLGENHVFGWHDYLVIFVFVMMALTVFLMHGHYVSGPLEKMAAEISRLKSRSPESQDAVRISWNGKDEFACLAASLNELLELMQTRSLGLLEENAHLKNIVASAEVELVVMNSSGTVLDVVHCPKDMNPVPGLVRGNPPDPSVWNAESRRALVSALALASQGKDSQTLTLSFGPTCTSKPLCFKAFVRRAKENSFPVVVFREECGAAPTMRTGERKAPLSRIAAGISRDLKKVFSAIGASAGRYANSEKPEVRETVSTVRDAVRAGAEMLENLLTLGGEMRMDLRPISVQALIDGVKDAISDLTRSCAAEVDFNVADGDARLTVDLRQMRRVFSILVQNSVEAFGAIPGRITVSARTYDLTDEEGAEFSPCQKSCRGVLLRVEDDGPGLSSETLAHAFEPYCSTKSASRGLGLAIADSIIEAHGGGMRLTSEKGVRTTVDVFLRFSERASEDIELLHKEFPGGEVLVVDDNKSVLKITAALLRAQKISAHVADCRADALRKFSELSGRIRAVFLDAQLGDETSLGLLQNMRDINAGIPIVVVSGYTKDEIDAMFAETPPDGYLMKPYTVAELKAVLDTARE